jgi:CTP synthase
LDIDVLKINGITTGQIYQSIIDKERKGEYLGQTVQFIPHVPEEIKRRIKESGEGYDFALIEIGGTVGDYENIPFLFALKGLERELGEKSVAYVLVTYLFAPRHIEEMKTKPTQQAIKMLTESSGIFPDFILCRSAEKLDDIRKKKIETYANIPSSNIFSSPDVSSIYQIPLNYHHENMGEKILEKFKMQRKRKNMFAE